jgi:hypothetical protein
LWQVQLCRIRGDTSGLVLRKELRRVTEKKSSNQNIFKVIVRQSVGVIPLMNCSRYVLPDIQSIEVKGFCAMGHSKGSKKWYRKQSKSITF